MCQILESTTRFSYKIGFIRNIAVKKKEKYSLHVRAFIKCRHFLPTAWNEIRKFFSHCKWSFFTGTVFIYTPYFVFSNIYVIITTVSYFCWLDVVLGTSWCSRQVSTQYGWYRFVNYWPHQMCVQCKVLFDLHRNFIVEVISDTIKHKLW